MSRNVPEGTPSCVTCVHNLSEPGWLAAGCGRRIVPDGVDPVTGVPQTKGWEYAHEERAGGGGWFSRKCGPKGRFHKTRGTA